MLVQMWSFWPWLLMAAGVAYLLGSISFAILISHAVAKKDIREVGSGNAGMTNVLRTLGKLPALWTTLGDVGKSVLAAWLGGVLLSVVYTSVDTSLTAAQVRLMGQYVAGLFCTLGHSFPVFFGFRGGKGVLVGLGMLLVTDWRVALAVLVVFVAVVAVSRMVSLGSLCGAATAIPATWVFSVLVDQKPAGTVAFSLVFTTLVVAILFVMHRGNIQRIYHGNERTLSFKKGE